MELNSDVVNLISCATQERLRGLLEKLTVIARHRISTHKVKEIISKFCTKFSFFAALKVNPIPDVVGTSQATFAFSVSTKGCFQLCLAQHITVPFDLLDRCS